MCTIIVLNNAHPRYPVVVAANRDEFYARPSRGPVLLAEQPRTVGGMDEQKGGTWMGVTEHGLFVGLTNQRSYAPRTRAPRSRGDVVLAALACATTGDIHDYIRTLDTSQYESFNLIYGDADGLQVAYVRRDERPIEILPVADGISVLSNDRLDAEDFPKLDRARSLVEPIQKQPWPQLTASLQKVLADHSLPKARPMDVPADLPFDHQELHRLQALCVHTDHYGTRSSTVVALQVNRVAHYLYAPSSPCSADLVDATHYVSTP